MAGKGLGVLAADFNEDGWMDLYVANDGEENHLWINLHDGRFENDALIRGLALNAEGEPEASMGVAAGDVDGDGDLDLFLTHQTGETNTFYQNLGQGYFEDRTSSSGLGIGSLPYTGFGAGFFDFDHDGDLDLLTVNGRVERQEKPEMAIQPLSKTGSSALESDYAETNSLYANDSHGRFSDRSDKAGRLTSLKEISRGAAFGDIDLDGDLDVLVTNCNGPARLFRNDAPKNGSWIMIRVIDPSLNRDAIGARVEIVANGKTFTRLVTRAFSYLVSNPALVHVGLGQAENVERVSVLWPDGSFNEYGPQPVNQYVTISKRQERAANDR